MGTGGGGAGVGSGSDADTVAVGDCVSRVRVGGAVRVTEPLDAVVDAASVAVALLVMVGGGVRVAVRLDCEGDMVALPGALCVPVGGGVKLRDPEAEGVAVAVAVGGSDAVAVAVSVGEAVGVLVAGGVTVEDAERVAVLERLGERVALAVGLALALAEQRDVESVTVARDSVWREGDSETERETVGAVALAVAPLGVTVPREPLSVFGRDAVAVPRVAESDTVVVRVRGSQSRYTVAMPSHCAVGALR